MMANIFRSILMLGFLIATPILAFADVPVDLRDKDGIIDPNDLNQNDPAERSLKIKEPPPPKTEQDNSESSSSSSPKDQSNDPGRGSSVIPKEIRRIVPPRQGTRPIR